ncbi:uncharacterized protein LOC126470728 [Schistocerca serialis cubense]|uniref:uncharacterized protein LOC126470728 n=1 Tax=Schistocerca serialis cubense TaxID=2023355 RepID=UPI00214ED591|nr:uncharacterized protein LOC126470728 [Schistocerca serialis cubense]
MSVNSFEVLLELVRDKISKKDTSWRCSIPAEERLLTTLRFLATGDGFQYVHYNLHVGVTTVGKIVAETCTYIWEVLSPLYMMTEPTHEKWALIAERFEDLWNFPNCYDAVDGKYIRIKGEWNCGSAYYNYKNFHTIMLQAVIDAEVNFLIDGIGALGRNNDVGVFLSSSF